jgi:hypothetical protein
MSARSLTGALLASASLVVGLAMTVGDPTFGQELAGAPGAAPPTEAAPRIKAHILGGSAGKPTAPIGIDYDLSAPPQLGVPFDVRITLEGRYGVTDLSLAVHADDGIEVGTPQQTSSPADGAGGTWTLAATAYKNGTLHLAVLAQGTVGDQHPSRELVIPIRIGSTAQAPQTATASSATRSSTQRVIVLPSEDR